MARRSHAPIGALAVLVVVLLGTAACDGSKFLAAGVTGQPVCQKAIQARLTRYGVKLDEMTHQRWYRDTFARRGGRGRTSGYRFYGRPASCPRGDVAISMWPNCGIQHFRTRGGCTLPEPAS